MFSVYDKIIEKKVGLGWSQYKQYIFSGAFWVANAANLMVIGFLIPILEKEWGINLE